MSNPISSASHRAENTHALYRAVWRWHFYAGLFVLPFIVLLAITGGAYLFRDEIDNFVYSDLKQVTSPATPALPYSQQMAAARSMQDGTVVKLTTPVTPTSSTEITIADAAGARHAVYVNPYTGKALGEMADRGTIMWLIRRLHSLAEFGTFPNALIEIVGGWTILLVLTGIYLWWPKRVDGTSRLAIRGKPATRRWWRDSHAVIGLFAGFFIIFLATTGMPWSVFWGKYANQFANGTPTGYPSGVRVDVPLSTIPMIDAFGTTGWTTENAPLPFSVATGPQAIGIDAATQKLNNLGLTQGYAVSLPNGPRGVYSASIYPDDLSLQRVIHLDQYSGQALIDMSYADYGPLGRGLEWGINVHMGQEFGLANQIFMLMVCISLIFMAVSAGAMWWKRRPNGQMGVPPLPRDIRKIYGVMAILAIGGIIFPLVGLSMIVILLLDLVFVVRPRAQLRNA
ncbi:PepSY-associated TM helix domain-containing protein [Thalassospira mesophila]|uniref:PepSY-associated TM helix domain-containing protein n=1 Tax=Thalassospira mesophila TaxID=1293891 RepID=A0A1Y2L3H7_9PROT|nr:PepSY domain-containing protein [Thalassospira mesophila]OSQ39774.1 PepSY-associated TM helix domain-containing protein [Thalassospira mesophila]